MACPLLADSPNILVLKLKDNATGGRKFEDLIHCPRLEVLDIQNNKINWKIKLPPSKIQKMLDRKQMVKDAKKNLERRRAERIALREASAALSKPDRGLHGILEGHNAAGEENSGRGCDSDDDFDDDLGDFEAEDDSLSPAERKEHAYKDPFRRFLSLLQAPQLVIITIYGHMCYN